MGQVQRRTRKLFYDMKLMMFISLYVVQVHVKETEIPSLHHINHVGKQEDTPASCPLQVSVQVQIHNK